ncbi:MAG: hypothetical protein AB7I27_00355 [Bacteriovoracaceae bacterium]
MSKSVKSVGKGLGGGLGVVSDLVLGKKDPGIKDRFVALDPLQQKALGKYGDMLDNTENLASNAVANQENLIRANAGDVERNAQKLVAQRGLGNSSVGLNAITGATRDMGDKINAARASLPGLKMDYLNNATNGIQGILNSRTFIQGTPGGARKGGLAPLIGAGIGGYYGGAGGAQAGMGAGQAATQLF